MELLIVLGVVFIALPPKTRKRVLMRMSTSLLGFASMVRKGISKGASMLQDEAKTKA